MYSFMRKKNDISHRVCALVYVLKCMDRKVVCRQLTSRLFSVLLLAYVYYHFCYPIADPGLFSIWLPPDIENLAIPDLNITQHFASSLPDVAELAIFALTLSITAVISYKHLCRHRLSAPCSYPHGHLKLKGAKRVLSFSSICS